MCRGKVVTDKDKKFIMANWGVISKKEIAKAVGVHVVTIRRFGRELGLTYKEEVTPGNSIRTKRSNFIENCELSPLIEDGGFV